MHIYHYTSFSNIGSILGKRTGEPSGLQPRKRIDSFTPVVEEQYAVFGLLEPTPESWVQNPYFPQTWRILLHELQRTGDGGLLLDIAVDTTKDSVFVIERAHREGFLYSNRENIPTQFIHTTNADAQHASRQSLIPLEIYIQNKLEYSLPEVLLFNPIPAERITVSPLQPVLETLLSEQSAAERGYLIQLITHGWAKTELHQWKRRYEMKHGPLEQANSKNERR